VGGDEEVLLGLQAAFDTVYDRAASAYSLDYRRRIEPPLSDAGAAWAQQMLAAASPRSSGE